MISFSRLSHLRHQSPGLNTCSPQNPSSSITVHQGSAFKRISTITGDGPLFFPYQRHSLCRLINEAVTFIITGLVIEKGEPTTFSAIEARPFEAEPALDLKASQKAISYLFTIFDAIGSGIIHQLTVRRSIPTRLLIEPEPSS